MLEFMINKNQYLRM